MEKKFLKVSFQLVVFAGILALFSVMVSGCSAFKPAEASADEEVKVQLDQMDASLDAMIENDPALASSSNPYDYIVGGKNQYYNTLIALGPKALPALEDALYNSKYDGLTEYLIAVAIEEITQADVKDITGDPYAWSDANEFSEQWKGIKESVPESIDEILQSNEWNEEEKLDRIEAYGLLAIPILEQELSQGEMEESFSEIVQEYVDDHPLDAVEEKSLRIQ